VSLKTNTKSIKIKDLVLQKVQDYTQLIKIRLSLTVILSSVLAFLIAVKGPVDWFAVLILFLGGFLVTSAANALNQVLEKDYDKLMERTSGRPVASGRMKSSEAVMLAGFMTLAGICFLAMFNPWTAFFGMVALVSYAFIYTPLKRISPVAIFVGAIPGALPALIGCTAAEGELTLLGLTLFTVQFFWQFPHFWSIGYLGFGDYKKAGFRFIPAGDDPDTPDRNIGLQAFFYAILLSIVSVGPWLLGVTGWISAVIAVLTGLVFVYFSWNFYMKFERKGALKLMFFSFLYIPLTFIAFYIDKI
jgi:protoheme IX farnesyltransferase